MKLTDDELKEVTGEVEKEPEGSISRRLLSEVNYWRIQEGIRYRKSFINYLLGQGLNDEDAEKVMKSVEAGNKIEHEEGACRTCEGHGFVDEMGCMGSSSRRCPDCRGKCKDLMRIKVPA